MQRALAVRHSSLAAKPLSRQAYTSSTPPCPPCPAEIGAVSRHHRRTGPQHWPAPADPIGTSPCSSIQRNRVRVRSTDPAQQQHGLGGSNTAGNGGSSSSRAGGIGNGGGFSWPPWANSGSGDARVPGAAQWHTSLPLIISCIILGLILDITGINAKQSARHKIEGSSSQQSAQQQQQQEEEDQLIGDAGKATGVSASLLGGRQRTVRDDIAALKRLLRELFAEQLTTKDRLSSLELAATADAASRATDDAVSTVPAPGSTAGAVARASSVRVTGHVTAGVALPWSQEADASSAASTMASCGAGSFAHLALRIHSVSADQKRRLTAKLVQLQQQQHNADMPSGLHLQQLLYRAQVNKWLHMLIAPLGGCLESISRPINPLAGQHGITHAVRQGHGLDAVARQGTGMALTMVPRGPWSFSAGHFTAGTDQHSTAQLSVHTESQCAASLVVAHTRLAREPSSNTAGASGGTQMSSADGMPLRWAGLQIPSRTCSGAGTSNGSPGATIGVAGVAPISDMLVVSGWAEHPATAPKDIGALSWGIALAAQPDQQGRVMAVAVMRPGMAPKQHASARGAAQPLLCELSCVLPAGDGLSLAPGAVLAVRDGRQTSVTVCLQSTLRF